MNHHGYVLPVVTGLLLLMSLIGVISLQSMTTDLRQAYALVAHDRVFRFAEKRLLDCENQLYLSMPPTGSLSQCCVIESTPLQRGQQFFRVSVHALEGMESISRTYHLFDENPMIRAHSRQQSIVKLGSSSQSHRNSKNLQRVSWREVLDLAWEKQLYPHQMNIWEQIKPCVVTI